MRGGEYGSDPADLVHDEAEPVRRGPVATPVSVLQQYGGNRAFGALLSGTATMQVADGPMMMPMSMMAPAAALPVPAVAVGLPGTPPALDDPSFNPTTRAHDLLRAVNAAEHTYATKGSGFFGPEEDAAAERRKIDFATAVTALDGLTASQVQRVEEVYLDFDKQTTLRADLFELGQSGRKSDLTDDQRARLQVLLLGTRPEPIPPSVLAELRSYPPEIGGRLKADLISDADAEPALHRRQADAIELHELLASELNDARRERVMTMHRRPVTEIDGVDALYDAKYGPGALARVLNLRLDGLQRMRMTELRSGNTAQADACAIEDKRRKIEGLNKQDEDAFGGGAVYDALKEQRRREKQALTGDIQSIIELNQREALSDPANAGRSAGAAVSERLGKILQQTDGAAGSTLGGELTRTLGPQDAAVISALTDPWNSSGSAVLVQSAAAQLAADEKAGTTRATKVVQTLRSFRELARHDLQAQAYDPAVSPGRKEAIRRGGENAVTELAQQYIDDYQAAYDRIAGGTGRSYDQIVASADDADAGLIRNLGYGGGQTSDLAELEHAMGKKDAEAVKAVLRKQPGRAEVESLTYAYNAGGEGRDLKRELFGSALDGQAATVAMAQDGDQVMVRGVVSGRDAAQVNEQFLKPAAGQFSGEHADPAAEAKWLTEGGKTEYGVTMANRGATGRWREIGGDPETERLLERTRDDLVRLGAQAGAEQDPARRLRLLGEIRRLRATLTGDADAYEKDNARVLGEIQSALSFAVSIALAIAIPGAGPGIVAFLQTTAVNIAATVASNFVIKMGDYSLADLKADVLGGALGAGGAKFGEELMGRVAVAVIRPAAEATAEAAGKIGVQTALSKEVGSLAVAGEKTAIKAEEFELRVAGHEAAEVVSKEDVEVIVPTAWEAGAREVGGFAGGLYGPKVLTGDFSLTVDEVLKALVATAAGKIAHRVKAARSGPAEETGPGRAPEEGPVPVAEGAVVPAAFHPEPVVADVFGPRSPQEMLLANGIPPASAEAFQQMADTYHVVIKVRPTNTASLPVLEAGGVAKPELIKAKTVNRTDLLIGGPPGGEGKVGFFEPRLPSKQILDVLSPEARQAVEDRVTQRAEEFAHYQDEYARLEAEGMLRIKDGVLQIADPRTAATEDAPHGQFKDIGGDHDLYEITSADGEPLPDDVRRALVKNMRSMGINVEHPDHVSWKKDSPGNHDPAADAKIRAQHETAEPLVAFVPKTPPKLVLAGEVVTAAARTSRPGDRYLPAGDATVVETRPGEPVGRTDETDFSVEPRHATAEEIANARAQAARESSPMSGDVGLAPMVGVGRAAREMARRLWPIREKWAAAGPDARAELLVKAVNDGLGATGVPRPSVRMIDGESSTFNVEEWAIQLGHPALSDPSPSIESFAMACDHARHEMEHAVLEFRVVRWKALGSTEDASALAARLNIRDEVAQAALDVNARPDAYEKIKGTPLETQAAEIDVSTRGGGIDERNQILAELRAADEAVDAAREATGPAAAEALAEALRVYEEAHEKYRRLPDEKLAWDAGRQVQIAVRTRDRMLGLIERAGEALTAAQGSGASADVVALARRQLDLAYDVLKRHFATP